MRSVRRSLLPALGGGLAALALQAPAQAALSLDDAVRLAGEQSRLVAASAASADAARERAVAAAERPDPVLRAAVENVPASGADRLSLTRDSMTVRSIGVAQEFTRAGKRQARAARFLREADAAEAERTARLAEVHREAALAWLERAYAERQLALLQAERDEASLAAETSEASFRGARGAQADVFAARTAVAKLDDRLAQAVRQRASAVTRLARWVGSEAAAEPLGSAPTMDMAPIADADLETRLVHHPEIAAMLSAEQAVAAQAEVARSERQSDWTVELAYGQRGPSYSNMVSLAVSVPLQWDAPRRQERELAARLAELESKRAEREDATRAHVAEVREALQAWSSNRDRLARYDAALLPLAAQRTQAALAAYRGGQGPLAGVLEARRGEIELKLERLALDHETARLWAGLAYLLPAHATGGQP